MKELTERIQTKLVEVTGTKKMPAGIVMRFSGKFGHAGRITENGRLYPRAVMEREIERLQPKLLERAVIGEADHPGPTQGGPTVRQSAFIITGLGIDADGEIKGEAEVVDTAAGRDLAALIRAGAQVGISSRGRGSSKPSKMTSSHPDFDMNRDWDGRDFDEVDEDFSLSAYDSVIGQAVSDAVVADFNEKRNKEEPMDIKLEDVLKNEGLMKGLLDSDAVKAKVAEAVEAATKELEKKHEETIQKTVKEYLMSDEFAQQFVAEESEGEGEGDTTEAAMKCAECGGALPKGAKFCPACGVRAAPAKTEQTQDEKDKAIEELRKQVDDLAKKNETQGSKIESMEKKDADREKLDKVEAIVDGVLKDQPKLLAESVREELVLDELTEENAKETAEKKLNRVKALVEATGGSLEPKGDGKVVHGDGENLEEGEKPKSVQLLDRI